MKPAQGQVWLHHSGRKYTIITITNECESDDIDSLTAKASGHEEKYPVTVVYQDEEGRIWSKSPARFLASMAYLHDEPIERFLGRVYRALQARSGSQGTATLIGKLCQVVLDAVAEAILQARQDEQKPVNPGAQ